MNLSFSNKKQRYRENTGFIDPKTLPTNAEGYRCCRYCSGSIKPPKRTFCSTNCVHEYRLRSSGTYLRQQVYQRDYGICVLCKLDTKELAKQLSILSINDPARDLLLKQHNIHKKRKIRLRKNGGGLWDADHIICVKDGGGQCGLANIRTLCIKCHKLRTADCSSKKYNQDELDPKPKKFHIKLKHSLVDPDLSPKKFQVKLKHNQTGPDPSLKKFQIKLKHNQVEPNATNSICSNAHG